MTRSSTSGASSDTTLDIDAILKGNPRAFEMLVQSESPRLFRMIQRIVQDEDEARSIMQETFLQAYKRLATFRKEAKFTTWLYAIGLNLARASLRKRRRYDMLEEDKMDRLQPTFESGMHTEKFDFWNPQRLAEQNERRNLVHAAIAELPPDYRLVITLRDIEELSTTEVAQVLDITEGAVRVRLHRARLALRNLLDRYFR
jgi:RNA polymerase sigma-70 factor, ECF subfamily